MKKSDFEILEEYLELRGDKRFLQNLEIAEQVLYRCQVRDTLDFQLYLLRRRIGETAELIIEVIKNL